MYDLWSHAGRIFDVAVVVTPVAIWLARWLKRIDIAVAFTKDTATIHLPHIYARQRVHDAKLGIEVVDHPNISYINGGVSSSASR